MAALSIVALGGLITIIILIVIAVIVLLAITISQSSDQPPPTPPLPKCNQIDPQTLPDISTLACCLQASGPSINKYINQLDDQTYNMVAGPAAINWFVVCSQFCVNGWDSQNQQCKGQVGQTDYLRCQGQLQPTTCQGSATPIAQSNNILYYGQSAGSALCSQLAVCST